MVCGFSCEDLVSMFKELKGLGVVVKELSNELRQLVRRKPTRLSGDRLPVSCLSAVVCFLDVSGLWVSINTSSNIRHVLYIQLRI